MGYWKGTEVAQEARVKGVQSRVGGLGGEGGRSPGACGLQGDLVFTSKMETTGWAEQRAAIPAEPSSRKRSRSSDHPSQKEGVGRTPRQWLRFQLLSLFLL